MPTRMDHVGRLAQAISDPTRRRLIERLRRSPGATTAELTHVAPTLSRFAVMKHVEVLRQAGLVLSMDDGRWRRHYLEAGALSALQTWLAEVSE